MVVDGGSPPDLLGRCRKPVPARGSVVDSVTAWCGRWAAGLPVVVRLPVCVIDFRRAVGLGGQPRSGLRRKAPQAGIQDGVAASWTCARRALCGGGGADHSARLRRVSRAGRRRCRAARGPRVTAKAGDPPFDGGRLAPGRPAAATASGHAARPILGSAHRLALLAHSQMCRHCSPRHHRRQVLGLRRRPSRHSRDGWTTTRTTGQGSPLPSDSRTSNCAGSHRRRCM